MKRFWKTVEVADRAILLDGRPVRTPGRSPLVLPTPELADAVAAEWCAIGDNVDPRAMPLTGFANAAIDRIAPDTAAFATSLAAYGETDLLCYRAEAPPELVAREAAAFDPLLEWARRRYDVGFVVTAGVVHIAQPPATVARLGAAVAACDAFTLAALSPLVTIGGSLVAALAIVEGAVTPATAFAICHVDELWQADRWGEEPLAVQSRADRRAEFLTATSLLALLSPPA